jgi:hypothetical protein
VFSVPITKCLRLASFYGIEACLPPGSENRSPGAWYQHVLRAVLLHHSMVEGITWQHRANVSLLLLVKSQIPLWGPPSWPHLIATISQKMPYPPNTTSIWIWGLSFFFFLVLEFELRAYTSSHSTSPFCACVCVYMCVCVVVFFNIGSHKLFSWAGFEPWSSWSLPPE